jgi:hypothetical protein
MEKRWVIVIVAIVAILILVTLFGEAILRIFSPTEVISRDMAENLVTPTIEDIWNQADEQKGLRVNVYPELLPKNTRITPAFMSEENGGQNEIVCSHDCWLFFVDEEPNAHFGHPVRYIIVDAETEEQQVLTTEWWPLIDEEPVFNKVEYRIDNETIVFYQPPRFDQVVEYVWPKDFSWLTLLNKFCETYAVIVCGYNDLPDTFDEDTNGMYNVLKDLDVPDSHIFYLSPHTTHAGVDRPTNITNVQWAINQTAKGSNQKRKVLFFYSSHGGIDSLSCVPGTVGGGYISSTDLDNWLDAINCSELIIVIEACHSGSLIGRYADGTYVAAEDELTGENETNRAIFTSASTDTSSYADVDWTGDPNPSDSGSETIWGYVEAFGVSSADTNNNDELSFGEGWQYAWDNDVTRINGVNTPQMVHTSLTAGNVYNYCPLPDLVVNSLTRFPISPNTSDEITFTVIVKNVGVGTAGASTLVVKVGGESYGVEYSVPSLASGETFTVHRQITLSVAQNYRNTVTVDVNNDVSEKNEGNNVKTYDYTVVQAPLPDLIVYSLTHSPTIPTTASQITFTAVVKNEGAGAAGPSTLVIKVGGESYGEEYSVPSLASGETFSVQRQIVLSVAQNYRNTVTVDVNNDVSESNETNNVETYDYTVIELPV